MSAFWNLTTSKIMSSILTEFEKLGYNSRQYTNFNFKSFCH